MALAELASRRHGVVSTAELRELGLNDNAIARRVRAGRLHRLHRGVYAVGHRVLTREGRYLAAALAYDGILSHVSAANLQAFTTTGSARVHVTTTARGRKPQPGILLHRCRSLDPRDTTTVESIRRPRPRARTSTSPTSGRPTASSGP